MKRKKSVPWEIGLMQDLKDPEFAAGYLNACLEDHSEDAEEVFLQALLDVAKAYGITEVSERAHLNRDSIYKALAKNGNPTVHTLSSILGAVGLQIEVKRKTG